MREILFQGKRKHDGEWVCGDLRTTNGMNPDHFGIVTYRNERHNIVHPESVGQYTGMNEFVVTDKSINAPLFEGDIVEVWSRRRPYGENITVFRDPTSQYDIELHARAVICFKHGKWELDYDNNYNKSLCKLKGNEQTERTVDAGIWLYEGYGYHGKNEDWHREHNSHYKWNDIVKIGNKFDNPELLEG